MAVAKSMLQVEFHQGFDVGDDFRCFFPSADARRQRAALGRTRRRAQPVAAGRRRPSTGRYRAAGRCLSRRSARCLAPKADHRHAASSSDGGSPGRSIWRSAVGDELTVLSQAADRRLRERSLHRARDSAERERPRGPLHGQRNTMASATDSDLLWQLILNQKLT